MKLPVIHRAWEQRRAIREWRKRFQSRQPPRRGGAAFIVVALFAVAVVAVVAFSASYQHQYELNIRYGQAHWVAGMQPLSVEGLIAGATLVIWYAAQYGHHRPLGAYLMLLVAVGQAAIMNLAADHRYAWPWLGPEISIWPAVAFVAAYEMAVWLVRKRQDAARRAQPDGELSPAIPSDAESAALIALKATMAAGNPYTPNKLAERFSLTRAQTTRVCQLARAGSNGHNAGSMT